MIKEFLRSAALVVAVALGLWIAGMLAGHFVSARGLLGPSLATALSPVSAGLAVVGAAVVCTLLGAGVARTANTAVGMFALGAGLYGLAWRLASAREVFMLGRDGGAYFGLAAEMIVWAAIALGASVLLFRLGGRLPDVGPDEHGREPNPLFGREVAKVLLAAIATLPAVWLIARSTDKGQAIGAAIAGGIATGFVGRLVAPTVQPIVFPAASVLAGALGYLVVGLMAMRGTSLADRALAGTLPPLAVPMPGDFFAGAFIGVAIGFGWAKSFLHAEKEQTPEAVVRRAGG